MAPSAALPPHPPPAAAEEVSLLYTSLLMMASANCTGLIGSTDRMGDTTNTCSDCGVPSTPLTKEARGQKAILEEQAEEYAA